MFRVLITYAPDEKKFQKAAQELEKQFNTEEYSVFVKQAAETNITEWAAADLIILGSGTGKAGPVHEDYSEIRRALSGINLAGRLAGFFHTGDALPALRFKDDLKDSEVKVFDKILSVESGGKDEGIRDWAAALLTFFKEGLYD